MPVFLNALMSGLSRNPSLGPERVPVSQRIKLELLQEAVERQSGCWFKVTSSSMEPTLFPGDRVLVKAGRGRRFNSGEIVLFLSGASAVIHRIIKKRRTGGQMLYWQKGDAVRFSGPIKESKIVGRVVALERGPRKIDLAGPGARVKNYIKVKFSNVKRSWRGDPADTYPPFLNRLTLKILFVLKNRALARRVLRFIRKDSFEFRQARPLHYFEIQRLFKLDRAVRVDPDCFMTVALKTGTVVGALVAQPSDSFEEWWINGMRVNRAHRGLGIGENLIHQTEQALLRRGAARLKMWALETNIPAINLYHKLGYRQLPADTSATNNDMVMFEKALSQGGA